MMPHPMMMPHPAQLAAPNLGQLQMMGQNNPPQGLPPNLLQPPGGPGATPLSLPAGVSLPQVRGSDGLLAWLGVDSFVCAGHCQSFCLWKSYYV